MSHSPKGWLLPTAAVAYVALSTLSTRGVGATLWVLLVPPALALSLTKLATWSEAGRIATHPAGAKAALFGLGTYLAAWPGQADDAALRAAGSLGLGLLSAGALYCIARQPRPPGLATGHRGASALDAIFVTSLLWTLVTGSFLTRVVAPDHFSLSPVLLDTASLFSSLGTLLILCASLLRVKFLRGLELGVSDRASAGLTLCIAGTLVAAGSGLVLSESMDTLAGLALAVSSTGIVIVVAAPSAERVAVSVRALLAIVLLSAPLGLLLAWAVIRWPGLAPELALTATGAGILVGLLARKAARPLAPEGSRWLSAIEKSITAAMQPHPEMALRAALLELRKAEPTSKQRPEVFRLEPSALLSVDIAGYMTQRSVEFPLGLLQTSMGEPERTLRYESLVAAQVRSPEVRPLTNWFLAHHMKTATALTDDSGPVGLLALPAGKRRSALSAEEAALLHQLAERLARLIGVTGALQRSQEREKQYEIRAESAKKEADRLRDKIAQHGKALRGEAIARVTELHTTAFSPGARITLQKLENQDGHKALFLETPAGVDPLPWAAHAHLQATQQQSNQQPTTGTPGPFIVLDLIESRLHQEELWDVGAESSPFFRAQSGTLVLLHPGALSEVAQRRLTLALSTSPPQLLIACGTKEVPLVMELERLFDAAHIDLPTLAQRAEDLHPLIVSQLARQGLILRGEAIGIDRAALHEIVQRDFPGNDAELRGQLIAAAATASDSRITLQDLRSVDSRPGLEVEAADPPEPGGPTPRRTRHRLAPRSRRH